MTDSSKPRSVIVADVQPIARFGIVRLLNAHPDFHVMAETGNTSDLLTLCRQVTEAIVILGLPFPEVSGLKLIEKVRAAAPTAQIILLGMHVDKELATQLLQNGVQALLDREASVEELVAAAEAVAAGRAYLNKQALSAVTGKQYRPVGNGQRKRYRSLTQREREVFVLIAQALSTREISERLDISSRTVENHRRRIMRKLGLHRAVEIVRYAAALELLA